MSVWTVTDFGAVGDGRTENRDAIQRTIDQASAAGGGSVVVPTGVFVTGTIQLRSDINLIVSAGAELRASPDNDLYEESLPNPDTILPIPPDHWHAALIVARGAESVTISGPGTIRGRGYGLGRQDVPTGFRPRLLSIEDCQDVTIEQVSLRDQDRWCIHLFRCDRVSVRGVTVLSHPETLTTDDGIDIDGCHDVIVTGCHFSTGDDAICVKSSDYLGEARSAENIVIADCTVRSVTCAIKIGMLESVKEISGVTITNLVAVAGAGIHIKARSGGHYRRIVMRNLNIRTTFDPAQLGRRVRPLDQGPADGPERWVDPFYITCSAPGAGQVSHVELSDSVFQHDGPARYLLRGAENADQVRDIVIRDVAITHTSAEHSSTWQVEHVSGLSVDTLVVDGQELFTREGNTA